MKATYLIVKAAASVNNKIDKLASTFLPLVLVISALLIGYFGINCVKQVPYSEDPNNMYGAIIGIGGGLVLWVFAIALALGDLYREH